MEEGKIPSRSDRHKKKKDAASFFHFSSETKKESVESQSVESEPTTEYTTGYQAVPTAEDLMKSEPEQPEELGSLDGTEASDDLDKVDGLTQDDALLLEQPMEPPLEQSKPVAKKKKKKKQLSPAVGFLLLLFMLCSGAWCGYAAMNAVLPHTSLSGGDQEMLDNINLLVLGCDEREGDAAARADVIMVATIRPGEKQVSIFSIPRDTRVAIAGHGQDKINHSMAYGGIPLVQSTVEDLLAIQIDHTVKVNFDGFINVIDALGGINIEVPCRMYKPLEDIDLLPGYQTLTGSEALAFVRWRGDGTGDYGRIERQQQFLSAATEKLKGMDLRQALDVTSAVMDSIETDMSIKQMTSYGISLLGIGAEDFKTYSFVGKTVWIHGVSYVEADAAAIADIVDKMQHGEPEPEAVPADGTDDGTAVEPTTDVDGTEHGETATE